MGLLRNRSDLQPPNQNRRQKRTSKSAAKGHHSQFLGLLRVRRRNIVKYHFCRLCKPMKGYLNYSSLVAHMSEKHKKVPYELPQTYKPDHVHVCEEGCSTDFFSSTPKAERFTSLNHYEYFFNSHPSSHGKLPPPIRDHGNHNPTELMTADYRYKLLHSIIGHLDASNENLLKDNNFKLVLDCVRVLLQKDPTFKNFFNEKTYGQNILELKKCLSTSECLLLKDESSISLSAYGYIEKIISYITGTTDIPILAPYHELKDLQKSWNDKIDKIFEVKPVQYESKVGYEVSLETVIPLSITLSTKCCIINSLKKPISEGSTLRF